MLPDGTKFNNFRENILAETQRFSTKANTVEPIWHASFTTTWSIQKGVVLSCSLVFSVRKTWLLSFHHSLFIFWGGIPRLFLVHPICMSDDKHMTGMCFFTQLIRVVNAGTYSRLIQENTRQITVLCSFFLLSSFCHRIFRSFYIVDENILEQGGRLYAILAGLQWEICLLLTECFASEEKGTIVQHFFGKHFNTKDRVSDITLSRYSDVKERNQPLNCHLKCRPH